MLKGTNGLFIVIVNGDGFLKRKNGYVFMSLEERMMMLSSQQGIDYVVPWDDGTQTVSGALELIKPNIFAKGGGDVSREDIPELKTCEKINCALITGIGGTVKIQSSTNLVTKFTNDKIQTNI
jgi:bifunctional ADP-heptose synthase (sugar kinase/adenylyltransferase)